MLIQTKDKAISVHRKTIHSLNSELQKLKVSMNLEGGNNDGDEVLENKVKELEQELIDVGENLKKAVAEKGLAEGQLVVVKQQMELSGSTEEVKKLKEENVRLSEEIRKLKANAGTGAKRGYRTKKKDITDQQVAGVNDEIESWVQQVLCRNIMFVYSDEEQDIAFERVWEALKDKLQLETTYKLNLDRFKEIYGAKVIAFIADKRVKVQSRCKAAAKGVYEAQFVYFTPNAALLTIR